MKMSYEFAKRLMDDLTTLAVLANGWELASPLEIAETEDYARAIFLRLCNDWEEEMREKWEIETNGKLNPCNFLLEEYR